MFAHLPAPLSETLAIAAKRICVLSQISELWRSTAINVCCPGAASLASDGELGIRLRGALGQALAQGASEAALKDLECGFVPPSAYALFHGDFKAAFGKSNLGKPYSLFCYPFDQDLRITLRLFGVAAWWAPAFADGLVGALRNGIVGRNDSVASVAVAARTFEEEAPLLLPLPEILVLETVSPAILRRNSRKPPTGSDMVSGVADRLRSIMPWMGYSLDWEPLRAAAAACEVQSNFRGLTLKRGDKAVVGRTFVRAESQESQALLSFAHLVGCGGRTTHGFGALSLSTLDVSSD